MESDLAAKRFKQRFKQPDLVITRVPPKSLSFFKDMAKEDFANDYGMCLKWLVDHFIGVMPNDEAILVEIDNLRKEVEELKNSKPQEPTKKLRKTVGGRILGGE